MRHLILSLCLLSMILAGDAGDIGAAQTTDATASSVEQEIKRLQGRVIEAILKADTSVMEEYYADDYTAIHGDGKLTTKTQEISNFTSGVTKYDSIIVREGKIRVYGDTAVVNALASVRTVVNGRPYAGDVRSTRVWVKLHGSWRVVAFQTTRVET